MADDIVLREEYFNVDKRLMYVEPFRKDENVSTL